MGLDTSIPRVKVIHDYSLYETRKPWISKVKTDTFIYPCVYTISQSKGIQCYYSSEKKEGHFDIPKVIWSNGKSIPIVDEKGIYGMTQFSYAIEDTPKNLPFIQQALQSKSFLQLMNYCKINQSHRYNYKVISLLKKDFWKEFLE